MKEGQNPDRVLNELLVKLFKSIMEIEEKYLITSEFKDISVNDMHIMEAIGKGHIRIMRRFTGI